MSEAAHGTSARWHAGCQVQLCAGVAHSDTQRAWGRARSQARLPVEVRQQLLDAIYAGQPFRAVLRDLGLTADRGTTAGDLEYVSVVVMFQTLSPRAAGDLARFIRINTSGMDSNWPRLMTTALPPGFFTALVTKRWTRLS